MEEQQLQTETAHCAGRCAVAWADNGTILTSGEDALVQVIAPNGEKSTLEMHDKEVIALCTIPNQKQFVMGTSTGEVELYSYTGEKVKSLTRMVLGVRNISLDKQCKSIVVTGDESFIRIVNVEDIMQSKELHGHNGPVRSASWSPDAKYLASVGCDGTCKIWDTRDWQVNVPLLHTLTCTVEDKVADVENPLVCHTDWHPHGEGLAVSGSKDIVIVDKAETWTVKDRIVDAHGTELVSIVRWSPNGKYLASVGLDNKVKIWDTKSKEVVSCFKSEEKIYDFTWSMYTNSFATIDVMGNLSKQENCVPATLPGPMVDKPTEPLVASDDIAETQVESTEPVDGVSNEISATNASDATMENAPQTETGGETTNAADTNQTGTEGNGDDDDAQEENSLEAIKAKYDLGTNEALSDQEERRLLREQLKRDDTGDNDDSGTKVIIKEVERRVHPMQLAFQPGETPELEKRRFMAWNEVGAVLSREEDSYSAVEIEFADVTKNRNIRFTDYYGFKMAALAPNGALFASTGETQDEQNVVENLRDLLAADDDLDAPPKDSSSYRATVFYRSFASWSHNSEWNMQLPINELVMAVAAGTTFCAVATTKNLIRIFRPSGVQEAPISLPGPVVAMVGSNSLLLVLYHRGDPFVDGTQAIDFELRNIAEESMGHGDARGSKPSLISTGHLPTPVGQLDAVEWVGFSDERSGLIPLVLMSDGLLRGLCVGSGWSWTPMLDTKTIAGSDSQQRCWPICVQGNKLSAVVLPSRDVYPKVTSRPTILSFSLCIPVLGLDLPKGAGKHTLEAMTLQSDLLLEQRMWCARKDVMVGNPFAPEHEDPLEAEWPADDEVDKEIYEAQAAVDANVLKHFVVAVKLEKGTRALGLAKRLHLAMSLNIALVQAQKNGNNSALVSRLEELIEERAEAAKKQEEEEEEAAEDDQEMFEDDDEVTVLKTSTKANTEPVPKQSVFQTKKAATSPSSKANAVPVNPFAKRTTAHSPLSQQPKPKKQAIGEQSEVSPVKPVLGRSSTFSKAAREEMHSAHKRKQGKTSTLMFERRSKKGNDFSA